MRKSARQRQQRLKRQREELEQKQGPVKRQRYVQNTGVDPHVLELKVDAVFEFESDLRSGESFLFNIFDLESNMAIVEPQLNEQDRKYFFPNSDGVYYGKVVDPMYPQYRVKALMTKVREFLAKLVIDDAAYSGFRVRDVLPTDLAGLTASFLGGGDFEDLKDVRDDIEQLTSNVLLNTHITRSVRENMIAILEILKELTFPEWTAGWIGDNEKEIRNLRQMMKSEKKATENFKRKHDFYLPYLFEMQNTFPLRAKSRAPFTVEIVLDNDDDIEYFEPMDQFLQIREQPSFFYLFPVMRRFSNIVEELGAVDVKELVDYFSVRYPAETIERTIRQIIQDNNINPANDPVPFDLSIQRTITRPDNMDDPYIITFS